MTPAQWRVVGLSGFALALSLAGDASLYAILPSQPAVAGVSAGLVGLLLSVNRLVRIGLNPLSGLLNDRVGRRRPYILALVLATLSTLLYAFVRGPLPWVLARGLWGASWALILVGAYSMLMDVASSGNRGFLSGVLQVTYFLGAALGMLGACLSDVLSFRLAMVVCAGVTALGLFATVALPETQRRGASARAEGEPARVSPGRRRDLVLANLFCGLGRFCNNGVFYSTLGRFLRDGWGQIIQLGAWRLGVASLTGALLLVRSLMGLIAGPVAGRLSDRLGRWPVVAVCALAAGLGFAGLATGSELPALAGGTLLLLGVPGMVAILSALVGDRSDSRRYGLAFGSLATFGDAGAAAGPLTAYALMSAGVPLTRIYAGCGIALLLAAAVAWRSSAEHGNGE